MSVRAWKARGRMEAKRRSGVPDAHRVEVALGDGAGERAACLPDSTSEAPGVCAACRLRCAWPRTRGGLPVSTARRSEWPSAALRAGSRGPMNPSASSHASAAARSRARAPPAPVRRRPRPLRGRAIARARYRRTASRDARTEAPSGSRSTARRAGRGPRRRRLPASRCVAALHSRPPHARAVSQAPGPHRQRPGAIPRT